MHNGRTPDAEADRLDRLWDDIVTAGSTARASTESTTDDIAHFVRTLDEEAPMLNQSQRDRIRGSVKFPVATGQSSAVAGAPTTAIDSPLPSVPRRAAKRRALDHPILQVAATILLLLGILGTWLITRPGGDHNQSSPLVTMGSPSTEQMLNPDYLGSVEVAPQADPQNLLVFIREISLAAKAYWEIPDEVARDSPDSVSRYLKEGQIDYLADGTLGSAEAPTSGRQLPSQIASITNTGLDTAVIVELWAMPSPASLPEPPAASRVSLFSAFGYQTAGGEGAQFILTRAVGFGNAQQGANSPETPAIHAVIESGSYSMVNGTASAWESEPLSLTPASPVTIYGGQSKNLDTGVSIHAEPGSFPNLIADSDESSILMVMARPLTSADIAQRGANITMSNSEAPLQADIRTVTIQPDGQYVFQQSGAMIIWGVSGTAQLSSNDSSIANEIVPNAYVVRSGDAPFSITNSGSEPVVFVLARVSDTPIEEIFSRGVTSAQVASDQVTLPIFMLDVRFSIDSAGYRGSQFMDQNASLQLVTAGSVQLRPLTDITVQIAGSAQTLTAFSDPVILSAGDWFLAGPGDGYETTQVDENSQLMRLDIAQDFTPSAPGMPLPSPQPSTPQAGAPIEVLYTDCTIAPRTVDDYAAIFATPYAETNAAVNHYGDTDGTPADQATIDGITDTMRQVVACNHPATRLQGYSVYSPALFQFLLSIGEMNLESIQETESQQGEGSETGPPYAGQLLVSNAEIFPDGRAGAWVYNNGEIAYVTFVKAGDLWLIDYWDDSEPIATPVP